MAPLLANRSVLLMTGADHADEEETTGCSELRVLVFCRNYFSRPGVGFTKPSGLRPTNKVRID